MEINTKDIIVITATYNRKHLLSNLYENLKEQTYKNFSWLVIDDGSTDNTEEQINKFKNECMLDIVYIKQENQGKSMALNKAFSFVPDNSIAVIIDDDEDIFNNAIDIVQLYYNKYKNEENMGMFHFYREDLDGNIIGNPILKNDLTADFYEWNKLGYSADGYIAYYGKTIKECRFPIFKDEKYVGPSVLLMLAAEKYKMIWSKEVLGKTSYREDGLTKQGRRLRLKNSLGMLYYCILLQNKKAGLKNNLKYSIMGYAYMYQARKNNSIDNNLINLNNLNILMKPFGRILWWCWNKRYL